MYDDEPMGEEAITAIEFDSYLREQRQAQDFEYRYGLLEKGIWETSGGQVRIADMSAAHIQNVIRMLRRYAENPHSDAQEMFAKFAIPVFEAALNR